MSWNTGSPIGFVDSSGAGTDSNMDGTKSDRPEFIGPGTVLGSIIGRGRERIDPNTNSPVYQYLDPAQYGPSQDCLTNPAINTHGGLWCDPNLGRNVLPGPMFTNIDFGVSKSIKITERVGFRFDANFFDLLNHPNFENPGAGGSSGNNFGSTQFGQSTETYGNEGGHRVTQLAIRFDF